MARVLASIVICLIISGCGTLSLFPKSAPSEPKKMFNWTQDEKITPRVIETPEGRALVYYESEKHFSTQQEETKATQTFMQKVGGFVSRMTLATIIFIVVALAFFGGAPIVWAVKKYFAVKNALRSTVAAIREIPAEDYEKIKPILAQKHDKKDRVIIDKVKSELQ